MSYTSSLPSSSALFTMSLLILPLLLLLYLHYLLHLNFFLFINFLIVFINNFLQISLSTKLLVFSNLLSPFKLLEFGMSGLTRVSDCNLGFFSQLFNNLREFYSSFFSQRRNIKNYTCSVIYRIKTKIRFANSFLNRTYNTSVPRRDLNSLGIRNSNACNSLKRLAYSISINKQTFN